MNQEILNTIIDAIDSKKDKVLLSNFDFDVKKSNQLMLFLKPEVFFSKNVDSIAKAIEMVEEKLAAFGAQVSGMMLLNWKVFEQYEIMDRHYGFINKMSKNASKIIEQDDVKKIEELLEIAPWTDYKLYWGHEYLAVSDKFDEVSLDQFWFTKKSVKIRGWFYVQKFEIDWELLVFVNAFHPAQLKHYTDHTHYTLLMLINSDTSWDILRNDLIGNTFPEKAWAQSIRGTFFASKDSYGLSEVSIAYNCVHLSAWPFEGMFELNNFFKDLSEVWFELSKSNLWSKMLSKWLSISDLSNALSNPTAQVDWKNTDLFGYTEDKNSDEAIEIYMNSFK